MNKETIMPDGRPLFAWENEIAMNRAEREQLERDKKEFQMLLSLLRMVEVEQTREYHSGDYLFRVKAVDIVSSYNQINAIEKAEITRI